MPQVFDQYSDIGKLTAETEKIEALFKRVETGVVNLNKLGFAIDSSKSIAATAKAAGDLEKIQQQLMQSQTKLDQQVERSRALSAKAGEAEAKQQLAELRLIEAKEKAYEKEQIAIEKRNRAAAAQVNTNNNADALQARQQALKEAEQAEIEYNKSLEETIRKQYELDAAMRSAADSGNQPAKLVKAPVDTDDVDNVVKYQDELEQLTGTLNENEQQQARYKKDLKAVGDELKFLDKNTLDAEKSTSAYKNKVATLQGAQNQLKRDSQELAVTIKAQVREQNAAEGSLERLRARLVLAQQAYDRMGEAERNSPLGTRLAGTVNTLTNQVNTLEQSTQRYGRNVGNYANGVGMFFTKAFSGLRLLANIIPGAGIAGILLAVYEGLKEVTLSFVTFGNAGKRAQEDIHNAMQETNAEAGKQVGELQALYKITQDSNQQLDDRVDATNRILEINKENNKLTGEHTQLLVDQNGVLKENDAAINTLTVSLFRQAKTKAYLKLIEEAYGTLLKKQNASLAESTSKFQDFFNFFKNSGNVLSMMTGKGLGITGVLIGQAEAKSKGIEDAQSYLDSLQKEFAKGLASGDLDLGGVFKPDKDSKKAAEKARKDALDLFKYRMGLLIDEQKALSELPAITAKYRIQAREKQAKLEKELISGVLAFELKEADITEEKKKFLRVKAIEEIRQAEAQATTGIIAIRVDTERMVLADIEREEKASAERRAKQELEFERLKNKKIEDLRRDLDTKKFMGVAVADVDIKDLEDQFSKGLITREQYEAQKLAIQNKTNRQSLNDEIEYYIQLLQIGELAGKDQSDAIKRLRELQHQINQEDLKEAEEASYKKVELQKQYNQAIKGLGLEALNTVQAALEGSVDRQKNKLQEQIDKIEELKNAEIDRITSTTLSEEEKANKIKIVEAKAQADRERLQQRQKELDRRKAMFDRAFGAFQIGINGIESVAKIKATVLELTAKAAANPLLAPLIPLAAAQIPISIATSAAQLVALLATPLPKFAVGTDYSPAGPAIVGEAGRELAVDPSGKLTLYDRPTIANLIKGTKILPNKVTEQVLAQSTKTIVERVKEPVNAPVNDLQPNILEQLKELNKKSRIVIHNQSGIESSAWYQQNIKN